MPDAALRSMTGFGAAAATLAGVAARVEVRAVNHRHLQVKSRLPPDLSHLEPQVEAAVRARLSRGSVTVSVDVERPKAAAGRIDAKTLRAWRDEIERAMKKAGLQADLGLDTLLTLPGVIGAGDDARTIETESRAVSKALEGALRALDTMRLREGKALAADLRKNAKSAAGLAKQLEKRMPLVVKEQHAALKKRLGELLDGTARGGRVPNDQELAREIALLADRMDVSEELTRLSSHLAQLETLLAGAGPAGRPLDFLVQELFREANTIGAKCNDATAAHIVVELKTLVERLREQIQNVE
jgi:uncharacterized protein (TIGR00255 family)